MPPLSSLAYHDVLSAMSDAKRYSHSGRQRRCAGQEIHEFLGSQDVLRELQLNPMARATWRFLSNRYPSTMPYRPDGAKFCTCCGRRIEFEMLNPVISFSFRSGICLRGSGSPPADSDGRANGRNLALDG